MVSNRKNLIMNILLITIFILLGNFFIIYFKYNEKYIYYWDIAGYWTSCIDFTRLFFNDFSGAAVKLYNSILFKDYTLLPVLAYIPVFKFISQSNTAFVLTTYNVFGVSFNIIMYFLFIKKFKITEYKYKFVTLLILFTFTVLLTPVLGGFLDICGLAVAAAILLFMEHWDLKKINPLKCFMLSMLILLLCFLRRWYSFWAVSFFAAYFVSLAIKEGLEGIRNKTTVNIFINLFISGLFWLVILFVFFKEFLIRVFTNNFSFAYSAYNFGGMGYNLKFILSQTGLLFIILAATGFIFSLRGVKNNAYSLFLILQSAVCLILFTRIQSLGVQHLYLFVPMILYFCVYAVISLPGLLKTEYVKNIVYSLLVLLISLNFFNSYFEHDIMIVKAMDTIFSQKKLYKRERKDIGEIEKLVAFINDISERRKYTYLLSSSGILNSDILKNVYLPDIEYATHNLLYTFDVDKRDGFPDSFYTADIIVVAEPVQYHLNPSEQQIVGVLANAILSGKAGDSLSLIADFKLDNDVTAHVYKKQKPYTHDFIKDIDNNFKSLYPEYDFLNDTVSIYSYMYDLDLQADKNIFVKDKYSFGMELGREKEGFKINLERGFKTVLFSISADTESDTGKSILIRNDKNDTLVKQDIASGQTTFNLDVEGCGYIGFEFSNAFSNADSGVEDIYTDIKFSLY